MAELDPRTNTEDQVEPSGELQPFRLGKEDQDTMMGRGLTNVQAQEVGRVLIQNKDLFTWTAADIPGIHPDSYKLSLFKDA